MGSPFIPLFLAGANVDGRGVAWGRSPTKTFDNDSGDKGLFGERGVPLGEHPIGEQVMSHIRGTPVLTFREKHRSIRGTQSTTTQGTLFLFVAYAMAFQVSVLGGRSAPGEPPGQANTGQRHAAPRRDP